MKQQSSPDGCLSNLVLDRLLTRELAEDRRQTVRAHLDGCPRCSARLVGFERERDQFDEVAPRLRVRAPARRRSWGLALAAAGSLAVAALVLLFLRPRAGDPDRPGQRVAGPTRAKGGLRLSVYLKQGDQVVMGRSGDAVHPGDAIRFAYTDVTDGYLAILSRDGAGQVSVYYPEGERAAPAARADQEVILPGSIILDEVLGPETLYAVHCAAPVEVVLIAERVQRGDLASLVGCSIDRLILDKRPP